MDAHALILERWLRSSLESYPGDSSRFLAGDDDPFRNPVGITLKESLEVLLRGLVEECEGTETAAAIDAIVRLRAVQNLTAREALGFLFLVRPMLREFMPHLDPASTERRVDHLALAAFEAYVRCREQLSELRLKESRRAMELTIARSRGCRP